MTRTMVSNVLMANGALIAAFAAAIALFLLVESPLAGLFQTVAAMAAITGLAAIGTGWRGRTGARA